MDNKNYFISISKEKLSSKILKLIYDDTIGAVVTFIGVVRNINEKKNVNYINYYIFDKLFYTVLEKKCLTLLNNDKNTKILVQQKNGIVKIGEINLIIGVSSMHRDKAFSYTKNLIEFIKNETPIWKKEYYINGEYTWLKNK